MFDSPQSPIQEWMRARVDHIRASVSAADVLAHYGIHLSRQGATQEQLSCPFHGKDTHPSARYYPDEGDSPSHVWCYVCREKRWDAIGIWKKFSGTEKFGEVLFQIERTFGITPPDRPKTTDFNASRENHEIKTLFDTCEARLKTEKNSFECKAHLILGSLLDRLRFDYQNKAIEDATVKLKLESLLSKIRERVRAKAIANPHP